MAQGQVNAVLWDMDGTLVDTAELHFQSWVKLASEQGKTFSREQFAATFGRRNPEIIPQAFGGHLTDADVAALGERKEELYRAAAKRGVDLVPGARKLLDSLRDAGFKQAVASSTPRANVALILSVTRTAPLFEAIVSMEDTRRGKPDPEVFLTAADKLGVKPDRCVVLEDAPAGVQAAKAGGMRCVAVTFVGHHSTEKLREAGADLVVETMEGLSPETLRRMLG